MIVGSLEQLAGSGVQIRPGVTHPTLGSVGGWEGTVLRSFTVEGTVYLDIEMSPSTAGALGAKGRSEFYSRRVVFTRFRVRAGDAEPLPAAVPPQAEPFEARAQHEWFNEVGSRESDPTKFVADRAAVGSGKVDLGRRQAIQGIIAVGVFSMVIASMLNGDCNNGRTGNGSWGRSGGFSS